MKNNFSLIYSMILLPIGTSSLVGMEKQLSPSHEKKHPLEESRIMTPVPTTRGLGFWRSTKDLVWDYQENNTYTDLVNKTFVINNSSYHTRLDSAIQICTEKKNSDQIANIYILCREEPYKGFIRINDPQAIMAHSFLYKKNKEKQKILKRTIEDKDDKFITQFNLLLTNLKTSIVEHIEGIKKLRDTHITERNELIQVHGDDIRVLKEALVRSHHLNQELKKLLKHHNEECSDEETDPDNVKNSYNNEHLLTTNNIKVPMTQTETRANETLDQLNVLKSEICLVNY